MKSQGFRSVPPEGRLVIEIVGKANLDVATEAMHLGVEGHPTDGYLKVIWSCGILAFLEVSQKSVPAPACIIVQLSPYIILFLFGTRLFPIYVRSIWLYWNLKTPKWLTNIMLLMTDEPPRALPASMVNVRPLRFCCGTVG